MNQLKSVSRSPLSALGAGLLLAVLGLILGPAYTTQAALVEAGKGPQLLKGADDDIQANVLIQGGAATNQSLDRTDVLEGGPGNDVMFGLNGNDVMEGGAGDDIILGGPGLDAIIFGATDRELVADPDTNVKLPSLTLGIPGFPQGIPTANVSGLGNFCTLEPSPSAGYQYLVRFRSATGNILATVRVKDVEQVFCSRQGGGAIAFADLTVPSPVFQVVSLAETAILNPIVGAMIR